MPGDCSNDIRRCMVSGAACLQLAGSDRELHLADVMVLGYAAIYAPATFIIKGLNGAGGRPAHENAYKDNSFVSRRCLLCPRARLIMAAGYFAYELFAALLLDITRLAAVANIPFNLIQAVGGVIIGALVVSALGKIKGIQGFVDDLEGK